MSELRDILHAIEGASAGMVEGRVVPAAEAASARERLSHRATELLDAAASGSPDDAARTLATIPPWARPLLDPRAMARLSDAAARVPPPDRAPRLHPQLGTFRWDEAEGGWVGRLHALGVDLVLDNVTADDVAARLALHPWCVTRPRAVLDAALDFTAADVLGREYREAGEPALTKAEVRARLSLTAITLEDEASCLHLDDGDLFWGNYVTVICSLDGTPQAVRISG